MVLAMLLMQLMVVGAVTSTSRGQDLAGKRVEGARAFYAAEAALAMAVREVMLNADHDGDGKIGGVSDDGNLASGPLLANCRLSVAVTTASGQATLTTTAQAGAARRRSQVTATLQASTQGSSKVLVKYWDLGSQTPSSLADIDWNAAPSFTTTTPLINVNSSSGPPPGWSTGPIDRFALEYTGVVTVKDDGVWTFATSSNDGSDLWVNGVQVVNNDGVHAMQQATGTITLVSGDYPFRVRAFEATGAFGITVSWRSPGSNSLSLVPASAYSGPTGGTTPAYITSWASVP